MLASADTALREARHMIWDMRAVELEGRTWRGHWRRPPAGDRGLSRRIGVRGDGEPRRLPLALETTALRVGREAVLNAVKHAAPARLQVASSTGRGP